MIWIPVVVGLIYIIYLCYNSMKNYQPDKNDDIVNWP
jgi:hypothetical protein